MLQPSLRHQVIEDSFLKVDQWAEPIPWLLMRTKTSAGDPIKRKMRINQGGIYLLRTLVMNTYGVPYDLVDWLIRGEIKESADEDADTILNFSEGTGFIKSFVNNDIVSSRNFFDTYFDADTTDDLDFDGGVYDVEMVQATGTAQPGLGTSVLDVEDGSTGRGKITSGSGTPFTATAGQLVRVTAVGTGATDYLWEDVYTVYGVDGSTPGDVTASGSIAFTTKLGHGRLPSATSNKNSTTVTITPLTLNEEVVIPLLTGSAQYRRSTNEN